MSMDTEEMVRAQPCDAVVLIGGAFNGSKQHAINMVGLLVSN